MNTSQRASDKTSPPQRSKITKGAIADQLATVSLFDHCSKRDLRTIARHVEVVSVAAGTIVVEQGSSGDAFFLILEGDMRVIRYRHTVAGLGPGDHFGELALLQPAPRSAHVIARSDVVLGVLTIRMFRVLLRDMPQITTRLLASLADQLRAARSE